MSKLSYLIFSILFAALPHAILGSSDKDNKFSTVPHRRQKRMDHHGFWIGRPSQQNLNIVDMDNPIKVELTDSSMKKVGYGLAIHPHFIVARPSVVRPGLMVASYEGGKLKHHEVLEIEPMAGGYSQRHCKFVLLQTTELIMSHNAYSEAGSFVQQGYKGSEIKCIREYVEEYIRECYHSHSIGATSKTRC